MQDSEMSRILSCIAKIKFWILTTKNFSRPIKESSRVQLPSTVNAFEPRESKVEGTSRPIATVVEITGTKGGVRTSLFGGDEIDNETKSKLLSPDLLHSEVREGSDKAFDLGRDELHAWIHCAVLNRHSRDFRSNCFSSWLRFSGFVQTD